ncbi:GTPase ObgE [Bryobacter aggregatus]|uniref:GTPase ObgE n=1 Tax=Bryobacter aggregatus TaxID=360054 RepID=UPI0004E26200|nr:GTPase ObgE [Bryobacter aggregatus]
MLHSSKFIDEAKVYVKGGDGGNGCSAFRREKFVPRGGPSGGDGGRGGDVIFEASRHYNTLFHLRMNPEHTADRGRHGEGSQKTGRNGDSRIVKVPIGTVVYDWYTAEQIHDFTEDGEQFVVARGGRGGRGNQHFATPTHQAPTEQEDGIPGQQFTLRLEMKLLADVGLVGFPNAGKSTLISRLSAAKPEIAAYPFTTKEPVLGVVSMDEYGTQTFIMADIPGLIEGASEGHGLGITFLRHVERTRVLLHLIDLSDFNENRPVDAYNVIQNELGSFSEKLLTKPQIVVATKVDSLQDPTRLEELEAFCKEREIPLHVISAITGKGLKELKGATWKMVSEAVVEPEPEDTEKLTRRQKDAADRLLNL